MATRAPGDGPDPAPLHAEPVEACAKKRKLPARLASRERFAQLHVGGWTNRRIAKHLAVTEGTVCRWLREPEVRQHIAALTAEADREVSVILARAAPAAARTLVSCMEGRAGRNWQQRVRAAESILDRTGHSRSERREVELAVEGGTAVRIAEAIARRRERLSKLTPDELRTLRALEAKVQGPDGDGGADA